MKKRFVIILLFASLILSVGLFASWQVIIAQTLVTKAEIVGNLGLKEVTKDPSYVEKLIIKINQSGVDFTITDDIEKELVEKGASPELIKAIKDHGPKPVQTPTPPPIQEPVPTPKPTELPTPTPTPTPTPSITPVITPTPLPALTGKELTKELILTGLTNQDFSPSLRITVLITGVREYGVNFILNDEIERELKAKGANQKLIDAIRKEWSGYNC